MAWIAYRPSRSPSMDGPPRPPASPPDSAPAPAARSHRGPRGPHSSYGARQRRDDETSWQWPRHRHDDRLRYRRPPTGRRRPGRPEPAPLRSAVHRHTADRDRSPEVARHRQDAPGLPRRKVTCALPRRSPLSPTAPAGQRWSSPSPATPRQRVPAARPLGPVPFPELTLITGVTALRVPRSRRCRYQLALPRRRPRPAARPTWPSSR